MANRRLAISDLPYMLVVGRWSLDNQDCYTG
jgi:hypothetical protein